MIQEMDEWWWMGWVNLDESLGVSTTTLKVQTFGMSNKNGDRGRGTNNCSENINNERVEIGSENKSYHKPLHFIGGSQAMRFWMILGGLMRRPFFQGDGDPILSSIRAKKCHPFSVLGWPTIPSPKSLKHQWSLDDEASDYSGVMQMLIFVWVH